MISDWNDLQTILAIARQGSLSAAARQLGLSQSTLSRRLTVLEQRLDCRIFARADGRLVATEAGSELVAVAGEMAAAAARLEAGGSANRPLRIASCEALAKIFLVPALSAWRRAGGQTGELVVFDSLFDLADDDFDILVTPRESAPGHLVGWRIADLAFGLYASPAYTAGRDLAGLTGSLAGHDVIGASGPLAELEAYKAFSRLGGRVVLSASNLTSQQEAAAQGLGIALLPVLMVAEDRRLTALHGVDIAACEVWQLARRATRQQPRIAAFLRWSRRYFPTAGSARRGLEAVA